MRATTTMMQSFTVMTIRLPRQWRYPFGLLRVVCGCMAVLRFPHSSTTHLWATYKVCVWTGRWSSLACSRTSTLLRLVLAFCHILCCPRVWVPGTGHTSCSSCARVRGVCVLRRRRALRCRRVPHTMLRSAVLAASCSLCVLGPVVCLLWSLGACGTLLFLVSMSCHVSFRGVKGLRRGRGVVLLAVTWSVGALAWRFACVSVGGGPRCVLSYIHTLLRLRQRARTVAPLPDLALFVLAYLGIPLAHVVFWCVCRRLTRDWSCPAGGLTKGLSLGHPRPYCICPHKAAPPHGGRARSPRAVPYGGFCPER